MAARGAKHSRRVTRQNNKEQKTHDFGVFTNILVCFNFLCYKNAEFILIHNQNTCEIEKHRIAVNFHRKNEEIKV